MIQTIDNMVPDVTGESAATPPQDGLCANTKSIVSYCGSELQHTDSLVIRLLLTLMEKTVVRGSALPLRRSWHHIRVHPDPDS